MILRHAPGLLFVSLVAATSHNWKRSKPTLVDLAKGNAAEFIQFFYNSGRKFPCYEQQQALLEATESGSIGVVSFLAQKPTLQLDDEIRGMLIGAACENNQTQVAIYLMDLPTWFDDEGGWGSMSARSKCLSDAAKKNNVQILDSILAKIKDLTPEGMSTLQNCWDDALLNAAKLNHHQIVDRLLESGLVPHEETRSKAMIQASSKGYIETVRLIAPNLSPSMNSRALYSAAMRAKLKVVKFLAKALRNDSDYLARALMAATVGGSKETVARIETARFLAKLLRENPVALQTALTKAESQDRVGIAKAIHDSQTTLIHD